MDDLTKKLLPQLDDPLPGVCANAFEALREHWTKTGGSFRAVVADLENALPQGKADELERMLAEDVEANNAAQTRDAQQRREIQALKAALWIKVNWKISGGIAVALLVVFTSWCVYQRYWSRSEAVNVGLRGVVAEATWTEGWGEPYAARIGGQPYWIMLRGDIDASNYSTRTGKPIEMRCVRLYAAPANPTFGEYLKPSPRNFLGWVKWPQIATRCQASPNQQADSNQ